MSEGVVNILQKEEPNKGLSQQSCRLTRAFHFCAAH